VNRKREEEGRRRDEVHPTQKKPILVRLEGRGRKG
jgi:hypothetical protein